MAFSVASVNWNASKSIADNSLSSFSFWFFLTSIVFNETNGVNSQHFYVVFAFSNELFELLDSNQLGTCSQNKMFLEVARFLFFKKSLSKSIELHLQAGMLNMTCHMAWKLQHGALSSHFWYQEKRLNFWTQFVIYVSIERPFHEIICSPDKSCINRM